MRKNITARTNARRIIFLFLIFSGILISVLYIPLYLTSGQEKVTNGKITFTDLNSNPLTGTIKISGTGITGASQENINSISWSQVPNAIISFDVFDKMGLSLNLGIYKDSPYSRVMIGDHGPDKPPNISLPAPGQPIKYVEIEARNVNFADANVTLRFTDDEIATINETELTLYIFDTIAQDWKELTTWIDTQNNTISATVDVMSVFALGLHVPGIPVYVPDRSGKNWTTFKEIISEKLANETPVKINNIDNSGETSVEVNNIGNSDNTIELQKEPGNFSGKIDLRDSKNKPIAGYIRTYDKNKKLKTEGKTDILSNITIFNKGDIEADALDTRNVAVKLKSASSNGGEIILDDYGKNNPVSTPLPGNPMKYVEIHANNISYSSAEVRIKYSEDELDGLDENKLVIYHWNGAVWEALATHVDSENNILSAQTESLSVFGTAAPGAAAQIRVFTDKHVYNDDPFDMDTLISWGENNKNLRVIIYVLVLDEDGNLKKNLTNTNFSGRLKDVHLRDHWDGTSATSSVHEVLDPSGYSAGYFYNITIGSGTGYVFVDNGSGNDKNANDGIYTATVDVSELTHNSVAGNWTSGISEEHIELNATVAIGSLNDTAVLIFSRYGCQHGSKSFDVGTGHGTHEGSACVMCHHGYEHELGDHNTMMSPAANIGASKSGNSYAWNTSVSEDFTGGNTGTLRSTENTTWSVLAPGSEFCYSCHWDPSLANGKRTLDFQGDTTPDRPSCSWSSSPAGVVCHDSGRTSRTNSSLSGVDWNWKLNGATGSKFHNYSTYSASLPCEACHGTVHDNSLPNRTSTNINSQCYYCHNISRGALNITRNGGTGINHSSSTCSNCHLNSDRAMDPHKMPVAQWPNASCTVCHETGGRAPKHVDLNSMNVTSYIHYYLNNQTNPVTNGLRWENRLCWACHGEDDNNNSIANYSEQPDAGHPANYTRSVTCYNCHKDPLVPNGTLGRFNSPIRFGHTPYGNTLSPPAINISSSGYCVDCHAQVEMLANYNDGEGTSNSTAAHYGKERQDLRASIGNLSYCGYCHQNASTAFPFTNSANKARSNHSYLSTTPSCGNSLCHGPYELHSRNLTEPVFNDTSCLACHTDKEKHHTTVQCMDCHMNDTQTNIHPVKYLQRDGISFSMSNRSAITCHNCHLEAVADNTLSNLGTPSPIKAKNKHGSNITNGSRWGDYWNHTPNYVTFVTNYSINANGTLSNFNNSKNSNLSYLTITETNTGSFRGNFPSNQNFTNITNWTSISQTDIITGHDTAYGIPDLTGSIYTQISSRSKSGYGIWNSSFVYNPVSSIANAEIDFNVRVTSFSGADTTLTNQYVIQIIRPGGSTATIFPATQISGVYSTWKQFNYSITSPGTVFNESGTYNIQIITTLSSTQNNVAYVDLKVYFDNIRLLINEVDYNRFDVNFSIDNVAGINITTGNYTLAIGYQANIEPSYLYVYGGTGWNFKRSLNETAMTMYYTGLNASEYNNSFVRVRLVDAQQSVDTTTDSFYVSTLYVFSDTNKQFSCEYCHNIDKHFGNALGSPESYNGTNIINQSISESTGTWCSSCHYQGYSSGSDTYNSMVSDFLSRSLPVPPEITGNTSYANLSDPNYRLHSLANYYDSTCFPCHGGSLSSGAGISEFIHNLTVSPTGGKNCILCHNRVTGLSNGATAGINVTSFNQSAHVRMNNANATNQGLSPAVGACWACHESDGNVTSDMHPDRQKVPKTCTECHLGTGTYNASQFNAIIVSEHYFGGSNLKAGNSSSNITSCINCHENVSEMILYNNDTDIATSFTGDGVRFAGGNMSFYHYGNNRTDIRQGASVNCSYCHQNASTAFSSKMIGPTSNKSISNHSLAYSSSNPGCTTTPCHSTGWLHNSTLDKPASALPNSSYCTSSCHGTGGSAIYNNRSKHNNSVDCTSCHLNSSRSIHPVRYLQNINNTWNTTKTSAVNCTNCHQNSTFWSGAPIIPTTSKHSSNISNGSIWNRTATRYWSGQNSSCYYCHNNTKHNATGMGSINPLLSSINTRNSTLTTTRWCADCHYNTSNPTYKGNLSQWSPSPPLITIDNTGKSGWQDHSGFLGSGYNDTICNSCHALNGTGTYLATSRNYSHSLDPGLGGGPNCITCHNLVTGLSGGAPSGINFTTANSSVHYGINSNNATSRGFAAIIGSCWACHDSDGNVSSGHPDRYTTPKTCPECHLGSGTYNASSYNATIVSEHYYSGMDIRAGNATSNISSCINCHENASEMILYNNDTDTGSFSGDGIRLNGGNLSYYHYGKLRTDIRSGTSTNCSYCHQNTSTAFTIAMTNSTTNSSIFNHSLRYNSSNPGCTATQCHNTGWLHNSTLTKPTLSLPNSTYCMSCHGSNGSGGTNYSGAVTGIKAKHNDTINCSECHLNTSKDIHPLKYLQPNTSFGTNNSTAVNCISCHQNSTVYPNLTRTPPKIANPMHHSDNASNGTIWNITGYWTSNSTITSCIYCHNDTKHNATALGRPNDWKGNNVVNGTINTSNWCSSCHYRGYSSGGKNYANMTSAFILANLSVPPEITNGTYAPFNVSKYFNHSLTNYSDATCKLCHGMNISSNARISEFIHNMAPGNSCTSCHYSFDAMNSTNHPEMFVDSGMYNTSLHRSLTCENCHTQGHKNIGARKACEDCHVVQATPISDKDRHNITETPSTNMYGGTSVVNISDCAICHNSALLNNSRNTYGYGKSKDCDYCHTYPDKSYN